MYNKDLITTLIGGSLIILLVVGLIAIAVCTLYVIGLWKLFKKAGKNGWEAIIPFYNIYVLIEISGLNWWYFLIAISSTIVSFLDLDGLSYLTDLAALVANFFCYYNIAKKMNQSPVGIGITGALFSFILVPILGMSNKYTFDNSIEVSPNGPIGDTNQTTSKEPERFCLGCGRKLAPGVQFCENCGKKVD